MSLNWNLTKIANLDEVCYEIATKDNVHRGVMAGQAYLKAESETLIWACMAVGMGGITEANHETFYARLSIYEKLNGAFLQVYDEEAKKAHDQPVTLELVKLHIGLSTNVSNETAAKWAKRIITDNAIPDAIRRAKIKREHEQEAA